MEQRFDRTGTGQGKKHPVFVLFDLGGDVAEDEDDGRGLRLAMGGGPGDPLVMATPRLLERGHGLTAQDGMARQAQDTLRPAGGGDPLADLRGGPRPIAPHQEVRGRPVAAQRRPQPDAEHGLVGARRAALRQAHRAGDTTAQEGTTGG